MIRNKLIIIMCVFNLIIPSAAFAGDVMPQGTVLSQESYVFTIEEATRLLKRIEELEAKEVELNKYKQLEELRLKQIDLYKLNLDYSQAQVDRYAGLLDTNSELIQRYQKRNEIQYWENFGYLALGITLTVGAFLAADAITDHMESTR